MSEIFIQERNSWVILQRPFDSSNRPDASFKVHEAGLKAPGGLETPTGWVHTKGKLSIIEPPTHISATVDKMLKGGTYTTFLHVIFYSVT